MNVLIEDLEVKARTAIDTSLAREQSMALAIDSTACPRQASPKWVAAGTICEGRSRCAIDKGTYRNAFARKDCEW